MIRHSLYLVISIILAIGFPLSVVAQSSRPGDIIEAQSALETLISQRLANELSTRLPRESFKISTSLILTKRPNQAKTPPAPKRGDPASASNGTQGSPSFLPSLMGLVDAQQMVQTYKTELETLRAQNDQERLEKFLLEVSQKSAVPPSRFDLLSLYLLQSVTVSIGIDEKFGEEYRKSLETWLQGRLEQEFGKNATGLVQFITPEDVPWFDSIKEIEGFLAVAFAALTLLACFLLWLRHKRRESLEAAERELMPKPRHVEPKPEVDPAIEKAARELKVTEELALASERVYRIISSMSAPERRQFIELMALKDKNGRIKSAISIENWLVNRESSISAHSPEVFGWLSALSLPMRKKIELIEEWKNLKNLPLDGRLDLTTELFWDAMAFKSLGGLAVEKPFEFMGSLSAHEVHNVLEEQTPKLKAAIFLFLPDELQQQVLSSSGKKQRLELLTSCFQSTDVESDAIGVAHEELKEKITSKLNRVVPMMDRLGGLLGKMEVLDEITVVRQNAHKMGGELAEFKARFPTLAFIDEWNDQSLGLFIAECDPNEIISLLKVMPHIETRVLASCTPIVAQVVREDMKSASAFNESGINGYLAAMNQKLKSLVANSTIDLPSAFEREIVEVRDVA